MSGILRRAQLRTTGLKAQQILIALLDEKSIEVRRAVVKALVFQYMETVPQEELQKSCAQSSRNFFTTMILRSVVSPRRPSASRIRRSRKPCVSLRKCFRTKTRRFVAHAAVNLLETGQAAKPALVQILKLADDDDKPFRRSWP